jgi:ferredoxin-thioredoxin reductase catalytic subunit
MKLTLNPNKTKVVEVKEALRANEGYCPCRPLKIPENKCVCEDVRKGEECICGLFVGQKEQKNIMEQET